MRKYISRIFSFLMIGVCLAGVLPRSAALAEAPYYKIPKYEDFKPNKAANDIEKTVNQKAVLEADAVDNKVTIDGEAAAKKYEEAVSEAEGYVEKLNKKGMHLNREPVAAVTVRPKNIKLSEFVEIVIDENNLERLRNVSILKIEPEGKNEYIALTKDGISYLADNGRAFRIQIKKLSDVYTIRFLDRDDSIIGKYDVDIKVALPAKHSEQTVYLFMNNTQENWGGQYNSEQGTIEFMTKYSGEYNVASPELVIDDIDDLEEYERQAIRFMAVRGYFETEGNKFKPRDELTRYDFAESLVRMFFALDNDAVCTFPDVNKKNYRYVAASQKDNIVQGFSDGTFKGEEKVTVEQVIALTARTINLKNGYVYPENTGKYLNFGEDNAIGQWAEKEVALAVREGIYSKDMNLKFAENISRKDAAVMLYRLFMIMNNTPASAEIAEYSGADMMNHETVWNRTNAIAAVTAAVGVNVAAAVLSILFIRKRRRG